MRSYDYKQSKLEIYMKAVSIIILILCMAPGISSAQVQPQQVDSLRLNDVIMQVLHNQPGLQEVSAEVEAGEASVNESKTAYYPKVEGLGSYARIAPVPQFTFAGGNSISIAPKNNFNLDLNLQETIYDFGRTKANIELAQSNLLTAKDRAAVVKWTLSYYAVQVFYSVLYLQQSIEVENTQIDALENDLDLVKKRVQGGSAIQYDTLTTKVEIAREQNIREDLKNHMDQQLINLRKLMGWPQSRNLDIKGILELNGAGGGNVSAADFQNRPDYQVLKDQEQALQQQKAATDKMTMPSLSVGLNGGFKNGYPQDLQKMYGNVALGLNLRVPIFDGSQTKYREQEVSAHLKVLQAQQEGMERNIEAQIAQAESDYQSGLNKMSNVELQIQQAEEQVKLARIRYQSGVITSQDLVDSEANLAEARLQKVGIIYHIMLSQYDLKKAMGVNIWGEVK